MWQRVKLLIHWLRHPNEKPPVTDDVDRRLDDVERRVSRVITVETANAAQRMVREHR